jgi:hypothetical protein
VNDGSMRIEDAAKALQGFAGAYEKIAAEISPLEQHELRIADINTTSCDFLIVAAMAIGQHGQQLEALKSAIEGVKTVFRRITEVVLANKHTKGKPYQISILLDPFSSLHHQCVAWILSGWSSRHAPPIPFGFLRSGTTSL